VIGQADAALYQAKGAGRDCVRSAPDNECKSETVDGAGGCGTKL
jgi:hypothetical protein